MSENPLPQVSNSDEIDLRDLVHTLFRRSRWIVGSTVLMFSLSAVYAFLIAKPVYTSSALLLPTETPTVDQMGAAAALLGGKKTPNSAEVDLYQSLLTSRTVVHRVLRETLPNLSDTAKGRLEPLWRILGIDTSDPKSVSSAVNRLKDRVKVDSKESGAGGILEIRFEADQPWLAQGFGNALLRVGQDQLREVRIQRADTVISRLEFAAEQAREEWDSSAVTVAAYRGSNRSLSLPDQMLELSRRELVRQAKEQKYLLARKELEMQTLARAKTTPPMLVMDPADLPARKSKPKRILLMFLGTALGFMGSCVGILFWRVFLESGDPGLGRTAPGTAVPSLGG